MAKDEQKDDEYLVHADSDSGVSGLSKNPKRARRAFGGRNRSMNVIDTDIFSNEISRPRKQALRLSFSSLPNEKSTPSSPSSSQGSSIPSQESTVKPALSNDSVSEHKPLSSVVEVAPTSVFDFVSSQDSTQVHQPTAQTALTVAKAYFDQLDASSPLALSSKKSPSKAIVRTRRRATVTRELRQEFNKYCHTCREAGVVPMSIESYMKQRSNFVSQKHLYDGFLDE